MQVSITAAIYRKQWVIMKLASLTFTHFAAHGVTVVMSIQLHFSPKAHMPPWTASNNTGFKSPYSPDATSMTTHKTDRSTHLLFIWCSGNMYYLSLMLKT